MRTGCAGCFALYLRDTTDASSLIGSYYLYQRAIAQLSVKRPRTYQDDLALDDIEKRSRDLYAKIRKMGLRPAILKHLSTKFT